MLDNVRERNLHFEKIFSDFGTSICGGRTFFAFLCFAAFLYVCCSFFRDFAWSGTYGDGGIFCQKAAFRSHYAYGNQYFASACFFLYARASDCRRRSFDEFALRSFMRFFTLRCGRNGKRGFAFIGGAQFDSDCTFGRWKNAFRFDFSFLRYGNFRADFGIFQFASSGSFMDSFALYLFLQRREFYIALVLRLSFFLSCFEKVLKNTGFRKINGNLAYFLERKYAVIFAYGKWYCAFAQWYSERVIFAWRRVEYLKGEHIWGWTCKNSRKSCLIRPF